MIPEKDRQGIALTDKTQALIAEIHQTGWFDDLQDTARFCMAYALKSGVPEGAETGGDTRWAIGNFDRTGEMRTLIAAVYPSCTTPVRAIEYLVNEGIRILHKRVVLDLATPPELFR